jgi:GAF domain-containing protein/anti-sigma regulatory factor (Ser/Thr protein kinase)
MLDWAIAQAPVRIALMDAQLRQLRLSSSLCRVLGLDSEAVGLGLHFTDLMSGPEAESLVAAARMVVRTGKPTVWRGNWMPGESRNQAEEINLSPVKDPAGRVRGVLVVGFDMTRQHLARERLALVNEASTRIGTTLDMTRTAEELMEVAVPELADFATLDLLDSVVRGEEPTSDPYDPAVPVRRMACCSVLAGSPEAWVQPGQVSCLSIGHSPAAPRLTSGVLVSYSDLQRTTDYWAEHDPARAAHTVRYGFHSVMVVPVRARGATLGIAVFVRHRRPEPFEDDDLVLAEEIVARAGVCLDNARRYTREHAAALALQRSLLPQRLPRQAAIQVATRYLPAGPGTDVGGDWFDVIRLSGSRVGLVVGDVVGHGIHAAATMGRLRTAVRTLADIDLAPGELLTRLDDVVTRLADEEGLPAAGEETPDLTATCLYAVYDPVSCRCSLARAGHPPPAVVCPGGTAELLDVPAGLPLGLGGLPFEEAEVELPEDSLLVLYTDGLIESRDRDIDTGLAAMHKVLNDVRLRPGGEPHAESSLETMCDTVTGALLAEPPADDAALLIARTHALAADRIVSWDVPAEPAVVACARGDAARQVAAWGLEDLAFPTELIVSELLTNAIRHAAPPIELRMILGDSLSCEVSDASSAAPHLRRADRYDEGGRGLLLVAQLADRWGSRHTRTGKTIWAQQPLPPDLA